MSAIIKIDRRAHLIVDDDVYRWAKDIKWQVHGTHKYARMITKGKVYYLHRMVMSAVNGEYIDHINRNTWDNRRCNLRFTDVRHNIANAPKRKGRNPYKGVYQKRGKKWTAQLAANRKSIFLGMFDTPEEAALVYNKAAKKEYGEFAYLNVIPQKP